VFLLAGAVFSRADYTVTTTSTKGWSKTETFNSLGLVTNSALTGTGIPTANLHPNWRADGSLSGVSFTVDGETHSASFKNDGTLNTLAGPGGNIPVTHTIASGVETLTVDGVTNVRRLDGTEESTSGDVLNKTEILATSGSGFELTTTPIIDSVPETALATKVALNAAGAPSAKTYAAGPGESYGYEDELLSTVSLARGGNLALGYSQDGAKDLTSAEWTVVASGPFTIPAIAQSYGYDRAGRIDQIGDSSGARSLIYQNGRLASTTYTSGPLRGYQIIKSIDGNGRDTGFIVKRDDVPIHSASKEFTGANNESGETAAVISGNRKIVIARNAARQITGFDWGNTTGTFTSTVSQRWQRGGSGRILLADSNNTVSGAPTFNYKGIANDEATAFDAKGRRLKCATAGGEWAYQYTNGRLTRAKHVDANDNIVLGDFRYSFDAMGRRSPKTSPPANDPNWNDLLNRTLNWENSQNKILRVTAHPSAELWVGIGNATPSKIQPFGGSYSYAIPSPGASGGWVPWNTLAILK
jgi:hypothetical protein